MNIITETINWVKTARGTHETDLELQIQQLELVRQQQSQEIDEVIKWLKLGDRDKVIADVCDNLFFGLNMPAVLNITPTEIQAKYEQVIHANWTKFCKTEQEAIESVEAYANGTHQSKLGIKLKTIYIQRGEWFVLFFMGNDDQAEYTDKKIAKSINWQEEPKLF